MSDDVEYRSWLAAVNNGRDASLERYAKWSRYDRNLAYRLEPGAMENLLDAAVEKLEAIRALMVDLTCFPDARISEGAVARRIRGILEEGA